MRKIFPVVAAGATTMALAAGTFGYAMIDKVVTLTVDGQVQTVHTAADTVGALLAEQGISTGSHDAIAPAPASSLADGNRISVAFGRPVTLSIDGAPQTRWTLATDVRSALFDFGVDPTGAVLSASPAASISRSGTTVAISTPKAVTVSVAGKTQRVVITGRSVADALAAAKVRTDGDDLMSVGSVERGQQATAETTVQDGSKVTVTQVVTKTTTKRIVVAYAVQRQDSKDLTKGTTKVQTPGTAGSAKVTYREVWRDGKRASRKKIKTTVVTKAKSQLVLVGTKETEKAAPVAGGGVWDKIAKCESGGNWSINTGNGFYGGLQFSLGTWRANGGSGKPNQASRAAQIAVAKRVQKSQGWGAWPGCTRKLGLR